MKVGGMKADGVKAAKAARAAQQTVAQTADASHPAMLALVFCLSATVVIVWLASGCGLAPCGAHGTCDGVFAATCVCLDGFLGDSCQYGNRYKVEGCHVGSHCGTFNQTSYTCDRAPVYQLSTDGPVLYRHTGRTTNWAIGPSERKRDCVAIPALSSVTSGDRGSIVYARSYWHDSSAPVEATDEPPSSPHFDGAFGGWRDFEAPHGSQLGAVKVVEG
jgi:hypothetical protein